MSLQSTITNIITSYILSVFIILYYLYKLIRKELMIWENRIM